MRTVVCVCCATRAHVVAADASNDDGGGGGSDGDNDGDDWLWLRVARKLVQYETASPASSRQLCSHSAASFGNAATHVRSGKVCDASVAVNRARGLLE